MTNYVKRDHIEVVHSLLVGLIACLNVGLCYCRVHVVYSLVFQRRMVHDDVIFCCMMAWKFFREILQELSSNTKDSEAWSILE